MLELVGFHEPLRIRHLTRRLGNKGSVGYSPAFAGKKTGSNPRQSGHWSAQRRPGADEG